MQNAATTSEQFFAGLATHLASRRKLAVACGRCAFVVLDSGQRWWFDAAATTRLHEGEATQPELVVVTNTRTLADMCDDRFDVDQAAPHHVLLLAGDPEKFKALQRLFKTKGQSWLSLRNEESSQ